MRPHTRLRLFQSVSCSLKGRRSRTCCAASNCHTATVGLAHVGAHSFCCIGSDSNNAHPLALTNGAQRYTRVGRCSTRRRVRDSLSSRLRVRDAMLCAPSVENGLKRGRHQRWEVWLAQ